MQDTIYIIEETYSCYDEHGILGFEYTLEDAVNAVASLRKEATVCEHCGGKSDFHYYATKKFCLPEKGQS
jgi:hypothetical protein